MTESELREFLIKNFPKEDINCEWKEMKNLKNSFNGKKILTIQDISCVGQCSLTVALPILSASGMETAILPSAVLSTHTGGFSGFTFRDLTDDMPAIQAHWQKEGIKFSAIYTRNFGFTVWKSSPPIARSISLSLTISIYSGVVFGSMGSGALNPAFAASTAAFFASSAALLDIYPSSSARPYSVNTCSVRCSGVRSALLMILSSALRVKIPAIYSSFLSIAAPVGKKVGGG